MLLLLACCAPALLAQSDPQSDLQFDPQPPPTDERAAFILTAGPSGDNTPNAAEVSPPVWTLVVDRVLPEHPAPTSGAGVPSPVHSPLPPDLWMLDHWIPSLMPDPAADLAAHFEFNETADSRATLSLADRWTRSIFSQEAGQLTSLTPGSQLFSWELTDDITLAGVGARRLFTDRDRAFVVSAEAGFVISPRAGLQVGYELLQTSAGGTLPDDAGGDSLFARFQLRF